MTNQNFKFSVLMSVYKNENASFFTEAIESILNQTLPPDEIVLVRDGPVPEELQLIIDSYTQKLSNIKYIQLENNVGLGKALRIGMDQTSYELVARMDTDDVSVSDRFEKQVGFMIKNPDISVCGGQIREFIDNKTNVVSKREVPIDNSEIFNMLKRRNPMNHVTVMMRKHDVMAVDNYMDFPFAEDYYLWCRMFVNKNKFANLSDVLVDVRVGEDMYRRRGGYKYFKTWKKLEKYKYDNGITNIIDYFKTLFMRFVLHVLLPNKVRGWVFRRFARN